METWPTLFSFHNCCSRFTFLLQTLTAVFSPSWPASVSGCWWVTSISASPGSSPWGCSTPPAPLSWNPRWCVRARCRSGRSSCLLEWWLHFSKVEQIFDRRIYCFRFFIWLPVGFSTSFSVWPVWIWSGIFLAVSSAPLIPDKWYSRTRHNWTLQEKLWRYVTCYIWSNWPFVINFLLNSERSDETIQIFEEAREG